ncbi:MAG: Flp pilus assembly complex ATPase component TadA [Candidatus Omnitrophota bacterium]|nr:MAG: Flp pilus assembly complex ATPase component TadA [Candidatus Omnitrophota bacterium]
MRKSRLKLGEILIKQGLITQSQLEEALRLQKRSGHPIGDILIENNFVSEKDVCDALARQLDIPFVSIRDGSLAPSEEQRLEKLVPENFARQYMVLPLLKRANSLNVAVYNPLDLLVLDNLRRITGCEVNPVIATRVDLREAIDKFYGMKEMLKEAVEETYEVSEGAIPEIEEKVSLEDLAARAQEAPVIKLVNLLLIQAVKERASDIHIEPFREKINVRIRIDGVLHKTAPPSQHLLPALISRIKILSKMDIAEKRLPQDGGFTIRVEDRAIDIRSSVIPTIFGEKAVLRILDRGVISFELEKLGFQEEDLKKFKQGITRPYGLIFITGPTGCGKSTTLYSALNFIKSPYKNIITIEDPVEYHIEGINQVQVKPQIGLTFANGLRSFLRQDPDIMMVGEVRDLETAQICIRAALTGHLLFSTLHTSDAPSAITRLIDIGVEPYLVASGLIMVMAQRLIRKLCLACKQPDELSAGLIKKYNLPKRQIFKAKGCQKCHNTGYAGRTAITEVMMASPKIRELIIRNATADLIRKQAEGEGMVTLLRGGLEKVVNGITSVQEALSTAFEL